jgi:hypothetical protein
MEQTQVTLLSSNSEAFPVGSRVWAQQEHGLLTKLADHEVEDITYFPSAQRIDIRTALGYHFSISAVDYHRLVPE